MIENLTRSEKDVQYYSTTLAGAILIMIHGTTCNVSSFLRLATADPCVCSMLLLVGLGGSQQTYHTRGIWGFQNFFGGPHNKDYSILRLTSGFPTYGTLNPKPQTLEPPPSISVKTLPKQRWWLSPGETKEAESEAEFRGLRAVIWDIC